jgi:hypothetical protein
MYLLIFYFIFKILLMPKEVAGRYLLKNVLGEGRFGRVYRAKDYKTSKKVAVKMVGIRF